MKINVPVLDLLEKAAQDGLKEAGKAILKRARELTPSDVGDSDKSGFSLVDDLTMQVGFKSHISHIQHENLDYKHKPEAWHNSMRLLKQEVLPRLKHLKPAVGKAA